MKKVVFCSALVIFLLWLAIRIMVPEKIFRSAVSQDNNYVAYLVERGGLPLPFFSLVSADLVIKDRANREVFRTTLLSDRDAFYETEAEFRGIKWVSNTEVELDTEGEYYAGPSRFQIRFNSSYINVEPAHGVTVRQEHGTVTFESFIEEDSGWFGTKGSMHKTPIDSRMLLITENGTALWFIEAKPSQSGVKRIVYGVVPSGFRQHKPATGDPPKLEVGHKYFVSGRLADTEFVYQKE